MKNDFSINLYYSYLRKSIFLLISFLFLLTACQREWDEPLKIVYIQSGNVWTMDDDGEKKTQLSSSGTDNYPVFSPAGSEILFVRNSNQLWIMNVDGTGQKLVFDRSPNMVLDPTFSPDGKKIAYSDNLPSIRVVDIDGSNDHSIYAPAITCNFLSWSPDGDWIIFESFPTTTIYRVSAAGGAAAEIINTGSRGVSYSPDGERIVGIGGGGGGTIRIWSNTGVLLTDFTNPPYPISNINLNAAWSPDGEKIVFENNTNIIYIMQKDGSNIKAIATSASVPSFQGKPR